MATIKALEVKKRGPAEDAFELVNVPRPVPHGRDLLVKLRAISINPVDTKVRKNANATTKILGYDGVGEVVEVGSEVKLFAIKDQVYFAGSILRNGTNAEYVLVDERIVGKKPKNLTDEQAAAIPLTGLTAWEGLAEQLGLVPNTDNYANKSLLVVAGAGGVGSIVIPLAKKVFKIGKVIATASRQDTVDFVKKLGADDVVDHHKDVLEQLKAKGHPTGVDYIFFCAEADDNIEKIFPAISHFGKIVSITISNKPINVSSLFGKRATLSWELMFTRPITGIEQEKQHDILTRLAELADNGTIPDRVTKVYSLKNELVLAHKEQESGAAIGKIVLKVDL